MKKLYTTLLIVFISSLFVTCFFIGYADENTKINSDNKNKLKTIRYYLDSDGDNYGTINNYQDLESPSGLYSTTDSGDCDDTNPAINPGVPEIIDGIDNNCDGFVE